MRKKESLGCVNPCACSQRERDWRQDSFSLAFTFHLMYVFIYAEEIFEPLKI